jgi:2,5-diketo-D-gluconate reductase A
VRSIPAVALNDGLHIPQVGFGLYKVDPGQTTEAVRTALEIGYRHFDTAQMYKNEHGVGQAVRDIGIDRADVFLIDWPLPTLYGGDFVSTWRTLEEFKSDGRAQHRGVELPDRAPGTTCRRDRHRPRRESG